MEARDSGSILRQKFATLHSMCIGERGLVSFSLESMIAELGDSAHRVLIKEEGGRCSDSWSGVVGWELPHRPRMLQLRVSVVVSFMTRLWKRALCRSSVITCIR